MKGDSEVNALFNAKARSWNDKYRPNGPLAHRVAHFSEILAKLIGAGDRVLDLGCGTGAIAASLASRDYAVTACDMATQMIESGKRAHADQAIVWCLLPADWNRLPFPDNTFDAIIASSVFEYLTDPENTLRECARVLKRGGKLVFSVPNPAHRLRRFERVIRPVALLAGRIKPIQWLPKIGNYVMYLTTSRMRLSAQEWSQRAKPARLWTVPTPDFESAGAPNPALLYLVLERMN